MLLLLPWGSYRPPYPCHPNTSAVFRNDPSDSYGLSETARQRIEQACYELSTQTIPLLILHIANGFNDLSYFIRTFKNTKELHQVNIIKAEKLMNTIASGNDFARPQKKNFIPFLLFLRYARRCDFFAVRKRQRIIPVFFTGYGDAFLRTLLLLAHEKKSLFSLYRLFTGLLFQDLMLRCLQS